VLGSPRKLSVKGWEATYASVRHARSHSQRNRRAPSPAASTGSGIRHDRGGSALARRFPFRRHGRESAGAPRASTQVPAPEQPTHPCTVAILGADAHRSRSQAHGSQPSRDRERPAREGEARCAPYCATTRRGHALAAYDRPWRSATADAAGRRAAHQAIRRQESLRTRRSRPGKPVVAPRSHTTHSLSNTPRDTPLAPCDRLTHAVTRNYSQGSQ
jgi:hypothetical protein